MVSQLVPRRIATLSVHTSPLDQPGTGDAGGLNVYVVEVAKRLATRGIEVEIFTRAVCRDTPPLTELAPGVLVRSVVAGPFEELDKTELPAQVCPFTLEVLRAEAEAEPGRYDLVHAHYWLSGMVGAAAKERWGVPLVQSMHTLGKVKNAALAADDAAEPDDRIRGEHEVVAAADRLIANTAEEAWQLTELYGADPAKIRTVNPGADLSVFQPGSPDARDKARRKLGIAPGAIVLMFAGRVQPLKGPDVVLKAAARLIETNPELAKTLNVVLVGGPSGRQERADPDRMRELAAKLGIGALVRFEPPCPQAELAQWYRAATMVLTPSHSESFGLMATTRLGGPRSSGGWLARHGTWRRSPRERCDTRPRSAGPRRWTGWPRCIPVPWTRQQPEWGHNAHGAGRRRTTGRRHRGRAGQSRPHLRKGRAGRLSGAP